MPKIEEIDKEFEEVMQDLPAEILEMAAEFGAIVRKRKITSPVELLRMVLLYSGLDKSLREVAGNVSVTIEKISDRAVAKRLEAAQEWIKAMLPKLLEENKIKIEGKRRLIVIDGTQIKVEGSNRKKFYRVHISMNLETLEFIEIKVTDCHGGESLDNYEFLEEDVVIADAGYCHPQAMINQANKGVELVIRVPASNVAMYDEEGEKLDLVKKLANQEEESTVILPITIIPSRNKKEEIKGTLIAFRLKEEVANKARRKAKRKSQKNGRKPSASNLFMKGWILVFSTLPIEIFSASLILQLYRLRWQIEIAIKRWKSLLNLGDLPVRTNSKLSYLWFHGKLLFALLLEKRVRRKFGSAFTHLDKERYCTWWRLWKFTIDELSPFITASKFFAQADFSLLLNSLAESPRCRKLQALSPQLIDAFFSPHSFDSFSLAA